MEDIERKMNGQYTDIVIHMCEAEATVRGRELGTDSGCEFHLFSIKVSPESIDGHNGGNTEVTFFNLSPAQSREIARQLRLQANRVEKRELRNLANGKGYLNRYNVED